MHTVVKRLLEKKLLTGKEMAILQLANWIEGEAGGEDVSFDVMLPILNKSSMYASEVEYKKYIAVWHELQTMQGFYCEKQNQASLACTGLILLYETIIHANFTKCSWSKYKLGKLSKDVLAMHKDLSKKLDVNYCSCLAIQAGFKAASEWLKLSKLEKTLPNLKSLNEQIATINQLADKILNAIQKKDGMLGMLDYAYFFKSIDLPELKTNKEDVSKAKAMLVLDDFSNTFDSSTDVILDAIQERRKETEKKLFEDDNVTFSNIPTITDNDIQKHSDNKKEHE